MPTENCDPDQHLIMKSMLSLDMIGKKFNRLTIMSKEGTDKKRQILYLCKCDCGNTKILAGTLLRNNKTKSCGCYKKEQTSKSVRKTNLLGKRFGQLLVIERSHQNGSGKTYWICICSCGNITKTFGYMLKSGHTTSCGCRKRGNQTHGTIYGVYEKGTNNLVYIGQTIKYNLEDRLKGHKIICKNDNFKSWLSKNQAEIKSLIDNVKIENLDMMEKQLIKLIIKDYHSLLNVHYTK